MNPCLGKGGHASPSAFTSAPSRTRSPTTNLPSGAGARAWFLAIVRNVAYSALQARTRSWNVITVSEEISLGDNVDAVSQEPSPEAIVIAQEAQQLFL